MSMRESMRKASEQVRKYENIVVDFLLKHYRAIVLVVLTAIAMMVRWKLRSFQSIDFTDFLLGWFRTLQEGGGFAALADFPGDYNAPYMTVLAFLTYLPMDSLYSIKLVSVIFDLVLAGAAAFLVYTVAKKDKKFFASIAYVVTLFLPQVILNGAYWGQCDSIYASFCILAITFLLRERYSLSFIMLGAAFAFKLQFIFILPIFLVVYLVKRKFSIFNFLLIPLTHLVLCLPAILAGYPLLDCFLVYFKQTQTYAGYLTLNFVNFFQILGGDAYYFSLFGIGLTVAVCALILWVILHNKITLDNEKILELVLLFAIVMTFFLPSMHERYLFVAEILGVLYYLVYRKHGTIILFINICAVITYMSFAGTTGGWFDYHLLALVEVFLLAYFTKQVLTDGKKDQKAEIGR